VMVIGQTASNRLVPLFASERENSLWQDGALALPLDCEEAFRYGETIKLWVLVCRPEAFLKQAPSNQHLLRSKPFVPEIGPRTPSLQVFSATPERERRLWKDYRTLTTLLQESTEAQVYARSFLLRRSTAGQISLKVGNAR
jgi:hypothetical protein